jgi:hypothetical protein
LIPISSPEAGKPAAIFSKREPDKTKPLDLSSVPQLQSLLRSKLWDDMINSLEKGIRSRRVGMKLKDPIQLGM